MRAEAQAVLLREARRISRRWQTYATRVGFSAAMISFILLGIEVATSLADVADMGKYGRGIFIAYAYAQLVLAGILAPIMGARAMLDERETGTMDLLVLTHLKAAQILAGKVVSRVLVLFTVVIGALPVLALAVTMGGVSVTEVVAVTVHSFVAVAVLGVLGAFFALFTRSTFLAAFAALWYVLPAFLLVPAGYALATGSFSSLAHVSPLFGPIATDWAAATLPLLAYAPAVWLVLSIGAPMFGLAMSRADVRRVYAAEVWDTRRWLILLAVLGVGMLTLLPLGGFASWTMNLGTQVGSGGPLISWWVDMAILIMGYGLVFVWFTLLIYVGTWVYLRLGIDLVLTLDELVGPLRRTRRTKRSSKGLRVWRNPVAWREARGRVWLRAMGPAFGLWLLMLFAILQSGLWLAPGGLYGAGLLNALVGVGVSLWVAVRSVEQERADGTLELVLASTLPTHRVVLGKALAAALPGLAPLVVAIPMILIGLPYLGVVLPEHEVLASGARGLATALWLVPVWLAFIFMGLTLAVRVRRPRSAYGLAVALYVVLFLGPGLGALVFKGLPAMQLPLQSLAPGLSYSAAWWQYLLSGAGATATVAALFILLTFRLRSWGSAHA